MANQESFSLQGDILDSVSAEIIYKKLKELYKLKPTEPSNLPLACRVKGENRQSVFDSKVFSSDQKLIVLFENELEVIEVSALDIKKFILNKEPWEDYDICIFTKEIDWIIGVTHNDQYLVQDSKQVLK